jgi:hypothetical protein
MSGTNFRKECKTMSENKEEPTTNGTDANNKEAQQAAAQKTAGADRTSKREPLPEKCKLCRKGKERINCEVCILDSYY